MEFLTTWWAPIVFGIGVLSHILSARATIKSNTARITNLETAFVGNQETLSRIDRAVARLEGKIDRNGQTRK